MGQMTAVAGLAALLYLVTLAFVQAQPDQLPPGFTPPDRNDPDKSKGSYDIYPYLPFAAQERLLNRLTPTLEQMSEHPFYIALVFVPSLLLGTLLAKIGRSLALWAAVFAGVLLGLTRLTSATFLLVASFTGFSLSEVMTSEPRKRGLPYMLFSVGFGFFTGFLICRVYLMKSIGLPLIHDIIARLPTWILFQLPSWLVDLN